MWWTSQRKLGRKSSEREGDAAPEPGAAEKAARGGERDAGEDSSDVKDDGVFGEQAEADSRADGQPPAWIFRAEQADDEVGDQDPPEEIEGRVLEFRSVEHGQGRECDGEGGRGLREAAAAEFFRHEAGDDEGCRLREDGEEAQADERNAEEREADVLEEWRERRVGDESPVEVARIAEELEFVAVEAVAAVGEHVQERDGGGDGEQDGPCGPGWGGAEV